VATKRIKGERVYEDRVLAYVDTLAWKDLIERSVSDPSVMANVSKAIRSLTSMRLSARNVRRWLAESGKDSSLEVTVFSDTVTISARPTRHGVLWIVTLLRDFTWNLTTDGIYTRGAIVRGQLHHRGGVIFGPALVDAYLLESTVAKYPRIIVSDALLPKARGDAAADEAVIPASSIVEDADTLHVLNVFAPMEGEHPMTDWVLHFRARVDADLKAHRSDAGIRAKLGWLRKFIDATLWKGTERQGRGPDRAKRRRRAP
jgi:hypothetical protein